MSGHSEPLNVGDYECAAREVLDDGPYSYVAGGAADERTLRDNVEAFARWRLRPRVLVDVSAVTTTATVLGTEIAMPVLVAPTAFQRVVHPEGELAMARGAAGANTIMCLSSLSSVGPHDVAAAAPEAARWFQLYWSRDRGFTRELLAAVEDAGFGAIVLTVDLPVAGRRERDVRSRFALPTDLPIPNIPAPLDPTSAQAVLTDIVDTSLTWRDLEWLRSASSLPLVIKGVLTGEDAALAVGHGAAAVVVSNHGGRQLDMVPASLDVLSEVVAAVDGRVEVLLDGGIRRGTDVAIALALGARAVLAGRAPLWGLAVGGAEGVRGVLELLRAELALALTLLGCASPKHIGAGHVMRAAR